ncbi:hypothetical protein Tco_1291238 [Tanacetum coccineum]
MKTDSSRDPNKVAVPKKKEIQREVDEEQQTNTYSAAERLEQIFNREARTEVDEEQQIQTDRQQTADSEDSDRQIQTADSNSGFRQRIQTADSDSGFIQRIHTADSDSGFGQRIQTTDSDSGFRQRIQTNSGFRQSSRFPRRTRQMHSQM